MTSGSLAYRSKIAAASPIVGWRRMSRAVSICNGAFICIVVPMVSVQRTKRPGISRGALDASAPSAACRVGQPFQKPRLPHIGYVE